MFSRCRLRFKSAILKDPKSFKKSAEKTPSVLDSLSTRGLKDLILVTLMIFVVFYNFSCDPVVTLNTAHVSKDRLQRLLTYTARRHPFTTWGTEIFIKAVVALIYYRRYFSTESVTVDTHIGINLFQFLVVDSIRSNSHTRVLGHCPQE